MKPTARSNISNTYYWGKYGLFGFALSREILLYKYAKTLLFSDMVSEIAKVSFLNTETAESSVSCSQRNKDEDYFP